MIDTIKEIYPNIRWSDERQDNDIYLNIPFNDGYYYLDRKFLSDTEIRLITSIVASRNTRSPWQQFLLEGVPLNFLEGKGHRLIQIHFHTQPESIVLWLETFASLFESSQEFFVSDKLVAYMIVGDEYLKLEAIESQIQIMDDDFSSKESIYIGEYYDEISVLKKCVQEERQLFESLKHVPQIHTYTKRFMQTVVSPKLLDSDIAKNLSVVIGKDPEDVELIHTLWEYQNNLTQAAQALYIHRNTLNYRLDRFLNTTGFNLRDNQDLLLCYLLSSK